MGREGLQLLRDTAVSRGCKATAALFLLTEGEGAQLLRGEAVAALCTCDGGRRKATAASLGGKRELNKAIVTVSTLYYCNVR